MDVIYEPWESLQGRIAGWPDKDGIPEGCRLNLGCGTVILPPEEGWVNVDQFPLPGVNLQANLFTFPWPFEDNSADYILASHIVEHIPHQVHEWIDLYHLKPIPQDGFFVFFREVWRILKSSGLITVLVPYGFSWGGLQDPTHTRYIVPSTFSYLGQSDRLNFDYGLDYAFEIVGGGVFNYANPQYDFESALAANQFYVNTILTLRADLRPVKGGGK